MIKFILDGKSGEIDKDFILYMGEGITRDFVLEDIKSYFNNYTPEKGDPFLNYADNLEKLGAKILKVEPENNSRNVVF